MLALDILHMLRKTRLVTEHIRLRQETHYTHPVMPICIPSSRLAVCKRVLFVNVTQR
jgi:hypothetical protein